MAQTMWKLVPRVRESKEVFQEPILRVNEVLSHTFIFIGEN